MLPALNRKTSTESCQPFEFLWKMLPSWPLGLIYPRFTGRYEQGDSNSFRECGISCVWSLCFFLFYQLQSLPDQPHYLDGFEVLYRSLLPASSDWAAKKVTLPGFQTQVGPLKRGYKYEFKVRPYGSNLYGRESNTRHLRVPETGNIWLLLFFKYFFLYFII